MEQELEESSNKLAITNGVILGVVLFVINILIYYVVPSALGSIFSGLGITALTIVLYVIFTIDLRKKVGGFWSFTEALKGIFLMAFIAGAIVTIANFIFYKYIESDAYDKIVGFVTGPMATNLEKMGLDQEQIDKQIDVIKLSLKSQYSPSFGDLVKTIGISILVQFVMSLIFAAIFKKESPVFIVEETEE